MSEEEEAVHSEAKDTEEEERGRKGKEGRRGGGRGGIKPKSEEEEVALCFDVADGASQNATKFLWQIWDQVHHRIH